MSYLFSWWQPSYSHILNYFFNTNIDYRQEAYSLSQNNRKEELNLYWNHISNEDLFAAITKRNVSLMHLLELHKAYTLHFILPQKRHRITSVPLVEHSMRNTNHHALCLLTASLVLFLIDQLNSAKEIMIMLCFSSLSVYQAAQPEAAVFRL